MRLPTAATARRYERPRAAAPSEWPGFDYADSAAASGTVFVLDPRATRIDVVVRRDGPLARFGHDHVVTVGEPDGFLLFDDTGPDSRADLRFRLDKLVVDSAEARARHELDTDPDAADIEGTRENLLEHVLDARQWPWATLGLTGFERQEDHYSAMLTVAISGSAYTGRQPFRLHRAGEPGPGRRLLHIETNGIGYRALFGARRRPAGR